MTSRPARRAHGTQAGRPRPARLSPPTGAAPPAQVVTPDGGQVDVRPLAQEVCRRYCAEYPDEEHRYGPAGHAWCVHDNQHILQWALLDPRGLVALPDQVTWLAEILGARDFPLDRLRRDLQICAEVVEESRQPWAPDIARRLRAATTAVRA
jgi:hypothetical protein